MSMYVSRDSVAPVLNSIPSSWPSAPYPVPTHFYNPTIPNPYNPNVPPSKTKFYCLSTFTGGLFLVTLLCAAIAIPFIVLFRPISDETTTVVIIRETTASTTTMISLQWNSTGETILGAPTMTAATPFYLNNPLGMVFDASDALYIADSMHSRVQKFVLSQTNSTTVAGSASGLAGVTATLLNYTNDVKVDSNGNIYVVDTNNHRVQLWYMGASTGITVAGNNTAGNSTSQLDAPRGIALNPNKGEFYVADTNNDRIMKYTLNSTVGTIVLGGNGPGTNTTQLDTPIGLYYDSASDSLIIANFGGHNIVRWSIGASQWTIVVGDSNGFAGTTNNKLLNPIYVILDQYENVYVADKGNNRIQFFRAGEMNGTTIAGVTSVSGSNATLLNGPSSIALDSQLNLYVVDTDNDRIQKFSIY